jgi:tRNA threonylcarbamoyladenosine biosynthesis protein TsaE
MTRVEILTTSAAQTQEAGRVLGGMLAGGELIELCGPLGAGKTRFAKGLAQGLGVPDAEPVVSPTFVLLRRYEGRLSFIHGDAYRLGSMQELLDLGLEEILEDPAAVVAIEWADRFPGALRRESFCVELAYSSAETQRRLTIVPPAAFRGDELAGRLENAGILLPPGGRDNPE